MTGTAVILIISTIIGCACSQINNNTFPENFSIGVATSAFQIEGAWKEDDKGESIWDYYIHTNSSNVADNKTADIACDSYHNWQKDVGLLTSLKVNHYRFSISWPRILPTGFSNKVNLKGILYYQNLIRALENNSITPMVTMYHWDLPEALQEIGGWTSPLVVDEFVKYAEILFEYFPSIKYWITINEPKQVCVGGYGKGSKAPGIISSGVADYLCAYHVIKAHAAVYHMYQEKYSHLGGRISIALDGAWNIPASKNQNDTDAAQRRLLFDFGLYAHPLYYGNWPDVVIDRVKNRSTSFTKSRLPSFSEEEQEQIKNTMDFIALNFYDTKIVADIEEPPSTSVSYDNDLRVNISVDPNWAIALDGNSIYPAGLRSFLNWINTTYNETEIEIIITENGIADDGTSISDEDRIYYLAEYLSAVLDSIFDDNINVIGYTVWSFMDNFEWTKGYSLRFGLYSINFDDAHRTRHGKHSATYFQDMMKKRRIPDLPTTTTTTSTTTTTTTTSKPTTTTSTTKPTTTTSTTKPTSTTQPPNPNGATNKYSTCTLGYISIVLCVFFFKI